MTKNKEELKNPETSPENSGKVRKLFLTQDNLNKDNPHGAFTLAKFS